MCIYFGGRVKQKNDKACDLQAVSIRCYKGGLGYKC